MRRFVILDETWVYHFNLKTRRWSIVFTEKIMASVFWYLKGEDEKIRDTKPEL